MTSRQRTEPGGHACFAGRIGVARNDITPPVGIYSRTWGAAEHDAAESVHRRLTLTAMTLASTQHDVPLVLIDADLSWWQSQETWRVFSAHLRDTLSLDERSLVVAVSHTHSAPPLTTSETDMPGGGLLRDWIEGLASAAVDAVQTARRTAFDATLEWHAGRCRLASVRDFPDPATGSSRFVCGHNPHAAADDTLLVGRVTDANGTVRATLSNYACHPTTLAWENRAISPDFVGALREVVGSVTDAPALFLQGASGELAPRNQYVSDPAVADRHGRQLAFATLATLADMEAPGSRLAYEGVVESGAPLAIWRPKPAPVSSTLNACRYEVELPLKAWPSADELDRQWAACDDRALQERIRRRRNVRRAVGEDAVYRLPFWVWRIGEAILVGSQAEAYSQLQCELRRRFPDRHIVCGNLMNGSIGYLPPAAEYDHDIYQVWQTPFARGGLEKTIDAMAAAIREIIADSPHDGPAR